MDKNILGLNELGLLIKRVLALNFQDKIWVKAEILSCKIVRGIAYLDLIEKEEGQNDKIIAQQSAVIWQSTFLKLDKKMPESLTKFLESGREVLILVQVDFNARYGLKLIVEDIDPAYTLGKLFQQRMALEKIIFDQKLHEPNKKIALPFVIQRIAILSNDQAAGYHDFISQLNHNIQGYKFQYQLFPISLQGVLVEDTVLTQMNLIQSIKDKFDVAIIIRGGGSKLDLAGFDSINICRAVSSFPITVITGIGHEIDETLVDIVAGISLKTPTAVAEFLLQHNFKYEINIQNNVSKILKLVQNKIHNSKQKLVKFQQDIIKKPIRVLDKTNAKLENIQKQLPNLTINRLKKEEIKLSNFQKIISLLSIENTLNRGFTITRFHTTKAILHEDIEINTEIETIWSKGIIHSKVINKQNLK